MTGRELLGVADVSDTTLLAYAAARLGVAVQDCALRGSAASVVAYDLDAITTAGRWWVVADVSTPDGDRQVRFFVKLVQSWTRSPYFAFVPPELREAAPGHLVACHLPVEERRRIFAEEIRPKM